MGFWRTFPRQGWQLWVAMMRRKYVLPNIEFTFSKASNFYTFAARFRFPTGNGAWHLKWNSLQKAGFEDVSSTEMFRVVQYASMTFDVEFHLLCSHSQLVKGKKKQKSTFKYSFTIITKASRKLCEKLLEVFERFSTRACQGKVLQLESRESHQEKNLI